MGRSLKKGPFVDEHLMKKLKLKASDEKKKLSNLVRRSAIFPVSLVPTIAVSELDVNVPVYIKEDMVV